MATATNNSRFAYIDCGSGKMTTGEEAVPFFMREGGEEIANKRQKELETFLKCLETFPLNNIILKEKTIMAHNGGNAHNSWFHNCTTKNELLDFLLNPKNHKVDGKIWSNGFLGSRWADTELNGRMCRIAFYTRKNDPNTFASFPESVRDIKDYAIIICPDYHY